METQKHKFAVILAKYFLRASRGQGLWARFLDPIKDILQGTVYLFAIKEITGISIDPNYIVYIVITLAIGYYFTGWADQKWGFWLVESEFTSTVLNPFNTKLIESVTKNEELNTEILDRVKRLEKKNE